VKTAPMLQVYAVRKCRKKRPIKTDIQNQRTAEYSEK
jgi:hypothetical protein